MTQTHPGTLSGACLCGTITFEIDGPFRDVVVCHCTQCAKWTGHLVATTSVSSDRFRIMTGKAGLQWYNSSDDAERGFCPTCGSNLFWRPKHEDRICIMAGTLDDPSGCLTINAHIHTSDQRAYIATDTDAPHFTAGSSDVLKIQPPGRPTNG